MRVSRLTPKPDLSTARASHRPAAEDLKKLLLAAETGHSTVPEETALAERWIDEQVGKSSASR